MKKMDKKMNMKVETKLTRIYSRHIDRSVLGENNHENPESKIQEPRCDQNFHKLGTPAELTENIQEHD